MESETFRTRVMALIQKSRRALRLYSSAGSSGLVKGEGSSIELSAVQVSEWREVNNLLLRKLTEASESPNNKSLVYDIFALRNEFQGLWRASEAEMVTSQRELIDCSERGDFVRATVLATNLVSLKARVQAGQAVHHELDVLIRKSRLVRPDGEVGDESNDLGDVRSTIELLDDQVVSDTKVSRISAGLEFAPRMASGGGGKVIHLKPR
jgi:hypothetical protein